MPDRQRPPTTHIEQHSSGANSPNIVGDQNVVNINAEPQPRRIPHDAVAQEVVLLSRNRATANVGYVANDNEAFQLASTIDGMLRGAGWTVRTIEAIMSVPPLESGIVIWRHGQIGEAVEEGDPAMQLNVFFRDSQLRAKIRSHPQIPSGLLKIHVGGNPRD